MCVHDHINEQLGMRMLIHNGLPQKPLAMLFFRKAHGLYQDRIPKELSPSFWEIEDRSPTRWDGFPAVLPGIDHELGQDHTSFGFDFAD